jgi:hypothetical protein
LLVRLQIAIVLTTLEISLEVHWKTKNTPTMALLYHSWAYVLKKYRSAYRGDICTTMFIEPSLPLGKIWNQPSPDE